MTPASGQHYPSAVMAVLIASELRKEFAGDPLFESVSFTVGRKDRLSLAGANGAGKTTLLRAIAGETSIQGGKLAFAKGTRVALHDQRPPLEFDITLREYALSGARDLLEVEDELRRLETAMAEGAHDEATLRRYAEAQARLEHAGGWAWRDRAAAAVRGLGFAEDDLDRPLGHVLGRRADARVAGTCARGKPGSPPPRRADEPPRRRRTSSGSSASSRRSTRPSSSSRTTAGSSRRSRRRCSSWRRGARTTSPARGTSGGRRRRRARQRPARPQTASRSTSQRLERFVERFRYKKSKAKQAQAKLTQIARLEKERSAARGEVESLTTKRRTLGFDFLDPPRSGRIVLEAEDVALSAGDKRLLDGRDDRGRARREGRARRARTAPGKTTLLAAILDGHPLDAGTIRLGHGVVPGYFSQHALELPTRGSVLDATVAATGLPATAGAERCSAAFSSRAGRRTSGRSPRSRAASGGGSRSRSSSRRARTSSSSTSRRTTSTSSRARRSKPRSRPFPARSCSSRTTARCSTPSRIGSSRSRTARCARTRAAGPTWSASAAPPKPPTSPSRRPRDRRRPLEPDRAGERRPSSSRSEADIAAAEARIAELERKLADDWTNMDVLTRASGRTRRAHRAPRALGGAVRGGARHVTQARSGDVQRACTR